MPPGVRIAPAQAADLADVAALFADYAASLSVDLAYQGFAAELASLPGAYAPPAGALLVARDLAAAPLGCVALRAMAEPGSAEIKRLYVAPAGRGQGVGRALAEAVMAEARRLGYREARLDTLPEMGAALALYRRLGFADVAPYYATPIDGTRFLGRPL
jgi:ribosomal protein S18 acetylase RimI-like enzyme